MSLQPIHQFPDQFRHNHVGGRRQEGQKCDLSEELQVFPIKSSRNDQKIKTVMLSTSDATFSVFLATRFVSQVPNVTEARLFRLICRVAK